MNLSIKTLHGLEEVLADELRSMNVQNIEVGKRVVTCQGGLEDVYRLNYSLRTALKILVKVRSFRVKDEDQLYRAIQQINWWEYFGLKETFAIDAVVNSGIFTHSKYVALKSKDAIVDQFRDKFGSRPNVNLMTPDLRVHLHLSHDMLTVMLDSSGDSLHYRGYRINSVDAPINEVLASGLIALSNWDMKKAFLDPMCGSGTILIEAYLRSRNISPQILRNSFGFQSWQDYDKGLWLKVKNEVDNLAHNSDTLIVGFDKSLQAVRATEINFQEVCRDMSNISVTRKDFFKYQNDNTIYHIVTNPPYDVRLELSNDIDFYKKIGDTFKQQFQGSTGWILSGNVEAIKHVGLKPSKKYELLNGSIVSKFHSFAMY